MRLARPVSATRTKMLVNRFDNGLLG